MSRLRRNEFNRVDGPKFNGVKRGIAEAMSTWRDASPRLIGRAAANIAVEMGLGHTIVADEEFTTNYASKCVGNAKILVREGRSPTHNRLWALPTNMNEVERLKGAKVVQAEVTEELRHLIVAATAYEASAPTQMIMTEMFEDDNTAEVT